jgi:hypothetical protein
MEYAPSNCWLVPLQGHDFDLEDLPVYLRGGPVQVCKRDGRHYLVLPFTTFGAAYDPIRDVATETVARINGVMTLLASPYWPIAVLDSAYFSVDEKGQVAHQVIPVGTAHERNKAGQLGVSIDGVPQGDPRTGRAARFLEAAEQNQALADALVLVGRPAPSWAELYLVFELVESNSGRQMIDRGWISKEAARNFKWTANSYTALGRLGRHGKNQNAPPPAPMSHPQAIELMRQLVSGWAKSLLPSVRDAA